MEVPRVTIDTHPAMALEIVLRSFVECARAVRSTRTNRFPGIIGDGRMHRATRSVGIRPHRRVTVLVCSRTRYRGKARTRCDRTHCARHETLTDSMNAPCIQTPATSREWRRSSEGAKTEEPAVARGGERPPNHFRRWQMPSLEAPRNCPTICQPSKAAPFALLNRDPPRISEGRHGTFIVSSSGRHTAADNSARA